MRIISRNTIKAMKVHLAGYNVDTGVLKELEKKAGKRDDVTPEVISAAYARISRDPRPINELRDVARNEVEKARKSNSTIIFKMGHHSVAEHAVFNLDIIGVSRLIVEEIEKFRLSSYTEKSQRYITLDKDHVVPGEIKGSPFEKHFEDMIERQNALYFELYDKLKEYVFAEHPDLAAKRKNHNLLEGWAKEDARYITALATEAQVGMTVNARNLEFLLRRFASHPLLEVQQLGRMIFEQIYMVAPSIILFHEGNDYDRDTYPKLRDTAHALMKPSTDGTDESRDTDVPPVRLMEYTRDADDIIAASLLHTVSDSPYEECLSRTKSLSGLEKVQIFKTAWENMQFYDSVLREFEYVNLTFEVVASAACFGQIKRHRMATITAQPYDPRLGVTLPQSILDIGMEKDFLAVINQTNALYESIRSQKPTAAPYILTNAHRKRILMRINARELYHISRLREDSHSQWDIRNIAHQMIAEAKKVMPLVCGITAGKDSYNEIYKKIFGRLPKVTEQLLPGSRKIK
jgi:flavin-dependent thymidylate synthase